MGVNGGVRCLEESENGLDGLSQLLEVSVRHTVQYKYSQVP